MAPNSNLSLIFKSVPESLPVPGEHLTIEDRPIDLDDIPSGGFITKNLFASLDPYMRMMLIPPGTKHYRAPFDLDSPLSSASIAEILASDNSAYPQGTIIRARLPIQQYTRITASWLNETKAVDILPATASFNHAAYLGPLGMPGLTAYSSIFEIGHPQPGETIFISAASGAVGQMVGQICAFQGLRVIGSVGSTAKLTLLRTLGFTDGFVYKTEDTHTALTRLCPGGVDIYYDNVGGAQLETALDHMNKDGRVVVCGMISQYNTPPAERHGVKNLFQFVSQGLTMRGFQVGDRDFGPKWAEEHRREVARWLETGRLKVVMSEQVGMERAADAFVDMLRGENRGKAVLRIWPASGEGECDGFRDLKV